MYILKRLSPPDEDGNQAAGDKLINRKELADLEKRLVGSGHPRPCTLCEVMCSRVPVPDGTGNRLHQEP